MRDPITVRLSEGGSIQFSDHADGIVGLSLGTELGAAFAMVTLADLNAIEAAARRATNELALSMLPTKGP